MHKSLLFFSLFIYLISADFAHFEGRSGQILLNEKERKNELKLSIWNENVKNNEHFTENTFIEYLSTSFGHSMKETEETPLIGQSTKKANILFVLDGIGSHKLAWPILDLMKPVTITRAFYPEDSVATATTLMTGQSPSIHGIVSKSWKSPHGGVRLAYRANALPEIQNYVDILRNSNGGASFTFSASSDFQMASAFAASQEHDLSKQASNNFGLFWNGKCFESIYPSDQIPFSFCKEDILKLFSQEQFLGLSVKTIEDGLFIDSVSFQSNNNVDTSFFAEVAFILALPKHLQQNSVFAPLFRDVAPDLFFFTFSSLKAIEQRYGANSPQKEVALSIVEKVISQTLHQFSELYQNQVGAQILFLENQQSTEEYKRSVYSLVKEQVQDKQTFEQFYPMLFLKDVQKTHEICNTLQSELSTQFDIYCQITPQFPIRMTQNLGNSSDPDKDAVASFHIVLWIGVILIFSTFAIVYSIYTMDVGGDSLVFRMTNLNNKKAL